MSVTKDGFYNIEGKMFEVVHGVEGDCLVLGDEDGGTRISGPKPWGGGQVTKTFVTQEKYGPIERLEAENTKLRELVRDMRKAFFALDIDHCQACPRDTINGPCTKYLVGGSDECSFEEDMRELRIEVK
jgi:hypothetical protein